MKKNLTFIVFLLAGSIALADRRPPDDMLSDTREVPASVLSAVGGVSNSTLEPTDRFSMEMSYVIGEPFSGFAENKDCSLALSGQCGVEYGYNVFEFYSDRLPIDFKTVNLRINGGLPITNHRIVDVEVQFKDDFSGLKAATFHDESGLTPDQNLLANRFVSLTLGDPNSLPENKIYTFDISFKDRAGNITQTPITKTVKLDMSPPVTSKVDINNGDLYVTGSSVSVAVTCYDNSQVYESGIGQVWVTTSPWDNQSGRWEDTSQNATVINDFFMGPEIGVTKTVYGQCRDVAGNWSMNTASSSITTGYFSPGGTVEFDTKSSSCVVTGAGGIPETQCLDVPLIISWIPSQAGSLDLIDFSIVGSSAQHVGLSAAKKDPPLTQSITIASSTESDGLRFIKTVFIDTKGNPSEPVISSITLNRNLPQAPLVDSRYDIQMTSITFTVSVPFKRDMKSVSFTRYTGAQSTTTVVPLNDPNEVITHTEAGLLPNTEYSFDIRSRDLFRESGPASMSPSLIYTRAAPPAFDASPIGKEIHLIHVSWGANGNPLSTKYLLKYSKTPSLGDIQITPDDWNGIPFRDVEGLEIATTYYFWVKARNNQTNASQLETDFVFIGSTTTKSFEQPLCPSNFMAEAVSSTTIRWRWSRAPENTEEGYIILSSSEGLVASMPLNAYSSVFTYSDEFLTPNTLYTRTIRSYNHLNGVLTLSASTGSTVLMPPAPPLAQPITIKGSAITANWAANGNPADTDYNARIAANPEFTNSLEESGWMQGGSFEFKGLRPNTTYYLDVQSRGREDNYKVRALSALVSLGSAKTQTYGFGNEIDLPDLAAFWKLIIPPNALTQDFTVQMQSDCRKFSSASIEALQKATEKARADSGGYRFPIPGGLVEIAMTNAEGVSMNPPLKKQATLIHSYMDIAPAGALLKRSMRTMNVDPGRIPAPEVNAPADDEKSVSVKTLRIWKLDVESQSWVKLPNNGTNLQSGEVNSGVPSFGIFAVMGAANLEVEDVIAYPVPFRPNGPQAGTGIGQTGTESSGIRFTNLPQEGRVSIFDLNGMIVKEINLSGNWIEPWDVRNTSGENVGSGTYFWITEAGGNRKKGKLVVIR